MLADLIAAQVQDLARAACRQIDELENLGVLPPLSRRDSVAFRASWRTEFARCGDNCSTTSGECGTVRLRLARSVRAIESKPSNGKAVPGAGFGIASSSERGLQETAIPPRRGNLGALQNGLSQLADPSRRDRVKVRVLPEEFDQPAP
jgi:hypothetical protein